MREKLNNAVRFVASVACAALIAAASAGGQNAAPKTQPAQAEVLTDAQAAVLIQTLLASQANPAAAGLTPAQAQLLSQYLVRAQAAQAANGSAANGAQAAGALNYAQLQAPLQKASAQNQTPASAAAPQSAPAAPGIVPLAPKRPGVVRVGIVTPAAQMGQGNNVSVNVAEPIRALIMQYLSSPAIEVTPVMGMVPAQVEAEARQEQCDYVLYSSIIQQKAGGMGFLSKAMPMANMIPMLSMAQGAATAMSTAMTAAAVAQAAQTAASTASRTVRAKNVVTLEYKLFAPGNATPILANAAKAKAKADGDDVISPLIQQAATAIVAEVTKKR